MHANQTWKRASPAQGRNDEDAMTLYFPAANKLVVLLAAAAVVATGFGVTLADAQTATPTGTQAKRQQQYDRDGRPYYGPQGPNRVYQQGPRTRIYVTTRSWLDAGTEVLPGDRKFSDYAFPPDIGYPTFARENLNRPIDRQPLSTPADVGGEPTKFPLY